MQAALPPGASWSRRFAIGFPTIVLRPTMTAWAPRVSIPFRMQKQAL